MNKKKLKSLLQEEFNSSLNAKQLAIETAEIIKEFLDDKHLTQMEYLETLDYVSDYVYKLQVRLTRLN